MTLGVTNTSDHSALATALAGQPLELLILNVGVYLDKNDDLKTGFAPSLWTQTFAVNVRGVFLTGRSLSPNLTEAQNLKITIISSQIEPHTRGLGGSYIYRCQRLQCLILGAILLLI